MFLLVSLSKSKFFTRVALVSFVSHSCRSYSACVALVSLVSHSCRTRVVSVALVLHSCSSCRTRVAHVWHSCCKVDQIVIQSNMTLAKKALVISLQCILNVLNAFCLKHLIFCGSKKYYSQHDLFVKIMLPKYNFQYNL